MSRLFLPTFVALAFATNAFGFGYPMVNTAPPAAAQARQPAQCQTVHSQPLIITDAIRATGWAPNTLMFGAEREAVKSMHILNRPNRPLHFYGNTVRFIHYRNLAQQASIIAVGQAPTGKAPVEKADVQPTSADCHVPPAPVQESTTPTAQ